MTTYFMEFVNNSDNWWHFGVYQEFPEAPGLDGVVWQEQGVPNLGARAIIDWKMEYGVAITNFTENTVHASQVIPAQLGDTYEVITKRGITGIDSTPIATGGPPGIVSLKNHTSPAKSIDMGFALYGSIIAAQKDVSGQAMSNYHVHPKYWVALFRNVEVGDLVSSSTSVSPILVEYLGGKTHAKITAFMESGETLTNVEYS